MTAPLNCLSNPYGMSQTTDPTSLTQFSCFIFIASCFFQSILGVYFNAIKKEPPGLTGQIVISSRFRSRVGRLRGLPL